MKLFIFFSFLHIGFVTFCSEQPHQRNPLFRNSECKLDKDLCAAIERERKELQKALAHLHTINTELQEDIKKIDTMISKAEELRRSLPQ